MPEPVEEAFAPTGWPEGFGEGPEERGAVAVLASLRGITPRNLHRLCWREESASAALAAIRAGRAGSDADRAHALVTDADSIVGASSAAGARFLTPHDDEYPSSVLELDDPPVALFVRGARVDVSERRVAIVGARRCSSLGGEIARDLGRRLGSAGVCVVSGAAYGIDANSHRGALDAGGRTIAVLGSGIDIGYPRSSADLISRIAEAGSVVSEYAPGVPAEPHRFPARNRIVVALASALVVVEGAALSGSRISVDHALDLGRDVFAVPGSVTSPLAEVPLALIRDGATMIRGADDLLHDLGVTVPAEGERPDPPIELPDNERRAWSALAEPLLPDAVARTALLSLPDAVAALIRLELRGLVRSAGGRYERTLLGVQARGDHPPADRRAPGSA
ncbi:MAG: DNA-processing protein DprA [Actinomycetota bacterium]